MMKLSGNTIYRAIHGAFHSQRSRDSGRRRVRKLGHEQLESRRVMTLPATQTFAEGETIVYNGPTVDTANDTLSFNAFIDFAGDVDSFFFAPQFSGSYTIDVGDFGNTVDPEVAVYNASTGAQVGYNDDLSQFNDDARLVLNLTSDVRYIIAVADQPNTTAGNVSIIVTAPFRTGSFLQSPDVFGDATVPVLLDVATDIDYYSIAAPTDATGVLKITGTASTFDHRFALFDSAGTLLVGPLLSINYNGVVPSQEYRIAVFSNDYATSGTLTLNVDFAEPGAIVTNTLDAGPGSLRQAILDANAHPNVAGAIDKISFNIPGIGPHIISLASALPTISDAVDIDGGTQPGTGTTPTVAIDGTALVGSVDGLIITSLGTAVRKLNVRNFPGDGIEVQGDDVLLERNTIGTDLAGLVAAGNSMHGIRIQGGARNRIVSNVLSANGLSGIVIVGNTANNNVLTGNIIGARPSGNNALPNGENGVVVINGDGNVITNNFISGNTLSGIVLLGSAIANTVTNNRIGTNRAGTAPLPNGGDGVFIESAQNKIGGNQAAKRNIISGNGKSGITINGIAASSNVIEGNYIGTNISGTAAIPNAADGIRVINAGDTRIGSTTIAAAGNVISGNAGQGITFTQAGTSGGLVVGNLIGTTADGLLELGNAKNGIAINAGATNIQIGSQAPIARNVISSNGANGISIASGSNNNRVSRNIIGTNISGAARRNGASGILIQSANNTIGGTSVNFANTIAGNTHGITLSGASATNNKISFNTIGTNEASNIGRGIQIVNNASANTIGPSNTIRRNESGIRINEGSIRNKITRNSIANNTTLGIDLLPSIGATANDPNDADGGANLLQNSPIISGTPLLIGADLEIAFNILSAPNNAAYPLTIEFFVSDGGSEGATFIGSTLYTAANFAAGVKTVSFAGGGLGLTAGVSRVVGTATDLNGNSSEFSGQRSISLGGARLGAIAPQNVTSFDVDRDGVVAPADALLLINYLNNSGNGSSSTSAASSLAQKIQFDTNGDKLVSPQDVFLVIQDLLKSRSTIQPRSAMPGLQGKDIWDAVLLDLVSEEFAEVKVALQRSSWLN